MNKVTNPIREDLSKLTYLEREVLSNLRSIGHEAEEITPEGVVYGHVYLDNGINTACKRTQGVLGSLEKKGYYIKVDGYAWGAVKLAQ